jgi:transcriptional regulator with XRE-family HTH domain
MVTAAEERHWAHRVRQVGQQVAVLRGQRGWTQEELAHRSGLNRTYIGQIEGGRRNVALRNLFKLADALDVTLSEMVKDID